MKNDAEKNNLAGIVAYRQPDGTFGPAIPLGNVAEQMSCEESKVLDAFAERMAKIFKEMYGDAEISNGREQTEDGFCGYHASEVYPHNT